MAPEDTKSRKIKAATVLGVVAIFGGAFYVAIDDTRNRAKTAQVQTAPLSSSSSLNDKIEDVPVSQDQPNANPAYDQSKRKTMVCSSDINGWEVIYSSGSDNNCELYLKESNTVVYDEGCNHLTDRIKTADGQIYTRLDLLRIARADDFDNLLVQASCSLPENKESQETLDKILKPYQK